MFYNMLPHFVLLFMTVFLSIIHKTEESSNNVQYSASWCHKSVKNEGPVSCKLYCHARCELYLSFLSSAGEIL